MEGVEIVLCYLFTLSPCPFLQRVVLLLNRLLHHKISIVKSFLKLLHDRV